MSVADGGSLKGHSQLQSGDQVTHDDTSLMSLQ